MSQKTVTMLGPRGHGHIGPGAAGLKPECVAEVNQRLHADSSYAVVSPMVIGCVDGRRDICSACLAGGILSVVVGYIAVFGVKPGETVVDILRKLQDDFGYKIILHEGCGALKQFMTVMGLLAEGDEEVYDLTEELGVSVSHHLRDQLSSVARSLPGNFMPPEDELFASVRAMGGVVERFSKKDHREACACRNRRQGTSFRREVLEGIEGDPQAFVLDEWVIPDAAARLSSRSSDQEVAVVAMVFFNCGVLEQLGDEDLGIEIHE